MSEIQITGAFNFDACDDCPVRDDCAAAVLGANMREGLINIAIAIHERSGEALQDLALHPTAAGRAKFEDDQKIIRRREEYLAKRAKQAQDLTTAVVNLSVESQILPDAKQRLANIDKALPSLIARVGCNGDHVFTTQGIDKIGRDVRYYSSTGVCGAIEVIEPNLH